jgi:hypothetical protein
MALLLATATASTVEAQDAVNSFDQLAVLVKPGDTVTVTDGAGRETRGSIAAVSSASLELMAGGGPAHVPGE